MKTVVFAARRREGVVVAPVGVTNNMEVYVCGGVANIVYQSCTQIDNN